jgi:uncharacterized protein YndB with AHSA1/START domain
MPEKNKITLTMPSPRELLFTRLFDAPPKLLFKMWTDPSHVVQWWGPDGFTTQNLEMNVRPGGHWRLIMHGPDGKDYHNKVVYLEVDPPKRLVFKHTGEDIEHPVSHQMTITFEEADGGKKTNLSMHMLFESPEKLDHVIKKYGADKGGIQTLTRLAQHLEKNL